ncbi:deoxynucleoside kinase [Vibrio vulnificus]|uniref:deoxynucleoside kinase n=1 Tax=Vibrio vulnificus TaxID=672 RepID=UPI001CCD190C|nr:deoxynucleoside kinase [Vibrio vulnificus]MCA0766293.1 deoxynucleoside kinase [Vibrio vulnificus]
MYIAIEGNIGAGKSTVLEPLAAKMGFEVIHEGIETDKGFQDCLSAFYESNAKEDFDAVQVYLANYRAELISKLDPHKNYIMERSLQGAALFCIAENHTDTATWTLQDFKHVPKPLHYIYLDCPAEICLKRIAKRGRECEQMIPLDYLRRVEKAHKEWAYMGEWAGIVSVIDSSGHIDLDTLADHINKVVEVKTKTRV